MGSATVLDEGAHQGAAAINARAETVAKSGMFRRAFELRRTIVPEDTFYEWKLVTNGKQPYAIARQDGEPMAFAGLWAGTCMGLSVSRGFRAGLEGRGR